MRKWGQIYFSWNGGQINLSPFPPVFQEWDALASVNLPDEVTKDGYVQLLITIRAIS